MPRSAQAQRQTEGVPEAPTNSTPDVAVSAPRRRTWTVWWTVGAPAVLVLLFWWRQALVGYQPTDDGFILAQSWRLLLGQTIHVDFTSPRPLGSAFLHIPDVISPVYTLAISRMLVLLQMLWIAAATVSLASWRMGLSPATRFVLLAFALLVNINTWPLMAWHTIDGVFLGITAMWLAMHSDQLSPSRTVAHTAAWAGAWFLAGAAPLVKQGFVIVPFMVLGLLLITRQWRGLRWAPMSLVPLLAYLAAANWQLGQIRAQLYSGGSSEALYPLRALLDVATTGIGVVAVLAALCAVGLVLVAPALPWGPALRGLAVVLVVVPTLVRATQEGFAMYLSPIPGQSVVIWPYVATLSALVSTLVLLGHWRRWVGTAAVLGLGFAVSASWGVPNPGIVAGSMLATAAIAMVLPNDSAPARITGAGRFSALIPLVTVSVLLVATSVLVLQARNNNVYWVGSRSEVTERVDIPAFRGITMSANAAAYVEQVAQCLDITEAQSGAIMPDGPGLYPLLRLTPLFDVDWWLPPELPADIAERNARVIEGLNGTDGWAVLLQSYDVDELSSLELAQVTSPTAESVAVPGFGADQLSQLPGQPITCGSLSGFYKPLR